MAIAPGTALSGIVLSATVRPRNAGVVGVSVLLLVSVRLGGLDFCAAWDRVLQAENLTNKDLKLRLVSGMSPNRRCLKRTTRQPDIGALR
jgi:hypothetical protein